MENHQCRSCGGSVDWAKAAAAVNYILKNAYHVDIRKVLDPLDRDDFVLIIANLTEELYKISGPLERQTVQNAIDSLGVEYKALTAAQLSEFVRAVNISMRNVARRIMPQVRETLDLDIKKTVRETKIRARRKYNLTVTPDFNAIDNEMVSVMSRLGGWITDEYGRRASLFSTKSLEIIQRGMQEGLRNEVIAEDLQRNGRDISVRRSKEYWKLVSTNASNRARSWGNLRSMDDAGIQNFIYSAIVDERTTPICRSLDGRIIPVSVGFQQFASLEGLAQTNNEAADVVWPFVRERKIGDSVQMTVSPPGSPTTIVGTRVGNKFSNLLPVNQMASAGVALPPVHFNCRSTILPDI